MFPRIAPTIFLLLAARICLAGEPLPGTQPLTAEGDLSVQMVDGIHRWLGRETERAAKARAEKWKLDVSSAEAWRKSLEPKRELLRKMIGAVDARTPGALETVSDPGAPASKAEAGGYTVERVRWPVFDGVNGEGLLLRPAGLAKAAGVALPDADNTPEQFAGIAPGLAPEAQFARRLAEQGALVVVMTLVDRRDTWSGSDRLKRFTNASHREWIYRQSFESGRTVIGFEVQKVLAAVDSLRGPSAKLLADGAKIGVAGYGEGGRIALFSAALDSRLSAEFVSGAFGCRDAMSREPLDRNLMGFAREFGDGELAAMAEPGDVFCEFADAPNYSGPPPVSNGRRGAAPGSITAPTHEEFSTCWSDAMNVIVHEESKFTLKGAMALQASLHSDPATGKIHSEKPQKPGCSELFADFSKAVGISENKPGAITAAMAFSPDVSDTRQRRTVREFGDFSQRIFRESEAVRKALPICTKLKPGAEWNAVQKQARADFWENVIGKIPANYLPPNPRTRLVHDTGKWRGYEVMLDVQPDIFAWGVLLVPKDLKPGERRPVVVCQHGLEGVPEDTITTDETAPAWKFYKGFAAKLCERGFIVYAPHNPYRGGDNFRRIQREANPLGLSLFSFIIAQHDVTTQWLASLPFVDPERIAFYGLSYGGKTAMRVPAALERYCLSICAGDFNEWVLKCVSNLHPASYIFTPEWEIWEWDLAHTFNYAEMALLIAPRPFMVERGHDDGVGLDEHVGYEFAKVRRGYDKLGIGERAEIEWFDGPHTIHGVGTFKLLHKWLRWPEPK
jgi:dienelactone hydrolase